MGMLVHEIAATDGSKLTIKFTRTCENFASLSTNILHYGFSLFCVLWNETRNFHNERPDELLNPYGSWLIRMKGF